MEEPAPGQALRSHLMEVCGSLCTCVDHLLNHPPEVVLAHWPPDVERLTLEEIERAIDWLTNLRTLLAPAVTVKERVTVETVGRFTVQPVGELTAEPVGELTAEPVGELTAEPVGELVPIQDPSKQRLVSVAAPPSEASMPPPATEDAKAATVALQRRLQAALATGRWDAAKIAEHAQQHAHKRHPVDAEQVEKVLAGKQASYHVRDAITAALDDLEPYAAP